MTVSSPHDIYIVGLGIRGDLQVTRETEEALSVSRSIFFVAGQPGIAAYLGRYDAVAEDLMSLYQPGTPRGETYEGMVAAVLRGARERPPAAFALYGHPLVFVLPSRLILQRAPALGLRVKVLPGISALDCLLVDLGLDPGQRGLIEYEATYALLYQPTLDPAVPCVLWQVGMVETTLQDTGISLPGRFRRLCDYLERFYPIDHRVALAVTPNDPRGNPLITWLSIDELRQAHEEVLGVATLFIPPSSEPRLRDPELQRLLNDADHLATISRPRTDVDLLKQYLRGLKSRSVGEAYDPMQLE